VRDRFRLDAVRHLAAPAAFLALVSFSVLSVTLPLGGRSLQQISAQYENVFTPAGYTFLAWLLICSGLGAFVLYQFLPSQGRLPGARRASVLFSVSCLLAIGWLVSWHFLWLGTSVVFMAALFVCVLFLYLQLTSAKGPRTVARRLMAVLPFRFYLGWLLVALPVNVSAWLAATGRLGAGEGDTAWAFTLFGVLLALGVLFLFLKNDLFVNLMLIWGLSGIAVGQSGNAWVVAGAAGTAALLLVAAVWRIFRPRSRAGETPEAADPVSREPGSAAERFTRRSDRD